MTRLNCRYVFFLGQGRILSLKLLIFYSDIISIVVVSVARYEAALFPRDSGLFSIPYKLKLIFALVLDIECLSEVNSLLRLSPSGSLGYASTRSLKS